MNGAVKALAWKKLHEKIEPATHFGTSSALQPRMKQRKREAHPLTPERGSDKVSYSGLQSNRTPGAKVLVRLHPDRDFRPANRNSFYGKFRCSVVLPTD